jgi:hypothetical protein
LHRGFLLVINSPMLGDWGNSRDSLETAMVEKPSHGR